MGNPLLAIGAKGYYVTELHKLLTQKLTQIDPNGWELDDLEGKDKFDKETDDLVKSYQEAARLPIDGMVGDRTWNALTGWELFNSYDDNFNYVPAPNKYHCWAAATAMMKGETSPNMSEPLGVLFENIKGVGTAGINNEDSNMEKFAKYHGFTMVRESGINSLTLCGMVAVFGRVMLNMRGVTSLLTAASANDSHFVVLTGLRGSGSPGGTTLRIFNPSIRKTDQRIVASYSYLKGKYPGLTYQAFYRITGSSKSIP